MTYSKRRRGNCQPLRMGCLRIGVVVVEGWHFSTTTYQIPVSLIILC
jgi:hypothetical protein